MSRKKGEYMRRKLETLALEKASAENWTEAEALEYIRAATLEELRAYAAEGSNT